MTRKTGGIFIRLIQDVIMKNEGMVRNKFKYDNLNKETYTKKENLKK